MRPRARRIVAACAALFLMKALVLPVIGAETPGQLFAEPLPGAAPFDAALAQALSAKWAVRDRQYQPRTRHLRPDGSPKYTNRLYLEASPYLLQHAHNPVNWYPWGDEAFETARKLGRPVVVSIGYSTCHWCHVMEEESFEDESIARYLNEHYIAIKVDREERPDIDGLYMQAVRMLTGQAGAPMTVWLTPDRRPFYGGTYVPPRDGDRGYPVGFLTLLQELKRIYDEQPDRVAEATAEISRVLQSTLKPAAVEGSLPNASILHDAARLYRQNFDSTYGGVKAEQKFPASLPIRFLLRYHRHTDDARYLEMATLTLEKMAAGGIHGQVGGGFHRYATDPRWRVPHFEKMLYDNALLALAYLEAYQATGREDFAQTARDLLRYAAREMTSPEGGFYSASDADSLAPDGHREEGRFFTWTPAEIEAVLGEPRARLVTAYYAVTAEGNFERRNVLHAPRSLEEVTRGLKLKPNRLRDAIEESKELLYAGRKQRPAPLRDEKILVAWNGLMIGAYARAALVLGDPAYAGQAARAADFILTRMRRDSRLLRSYKDGLACHNAYLDDYAFFIAGLLDLFEATGELRWLKEAVELDGILERFHEDPAGGYFLTSSDHEMLLAREKPAFDGAEPSGNSVQLLNLLRLSEFTTDDRYRQRAQRTLKAFSTQLAQTPAALSEMLLALDYHLDTPKEVVVVTPSKRMEAEPFLAKLGTVFLPNRVLVVSTEGEDLKAQAKMIPFLAGKLARKGKATAYVCERQVCKFPTDDPAVFARQIREARLLGAAPVGKISP